MPTHGEKHDPHPTPRLTSNTDTYPQIFAEIYACDTRLPVCTIARVYDAFKIDVGSIYPRTHEDRAAVKMQEDKCLARVTECRVCKVEGVSPYVGIRIGGTGWKYAGSLIAYKND